MSQFLRILTGLRRKLLEPKVYVVTVLDGKGSSLLHLTAAYTLEEAWELAFEEARFVHPELFGIGKKLVQGAYKVMTVDELLGPVMDIALQVTDIQLQKEKEKLPVVSKNELMAKIIASKDAALLEENRSKFSEPEYQFLEAKIKLK